ncbi:hypothetical protein MM1S1540310_3144 [Mycobacteroides abscessus subsp. bolletii 1S-154-0310]|nr:hypothetical protein [Mycobacteroides abscessus]EIU63246.1 hypothetical protein MM1S1510930_3587 [Mycobacteroides abscessus subsp. bolletii 1S-151-0930]EIU67936.1 hypothetical protein MM1S1520914_3793 [Mycobacteroides abscessus subsp. bolletii 1S-152-0914]EIU73826.1 hypothetical protein MM1S1530915_3137 [Mycobacteroides abscessus subsp. bolletii 1S-153-0915]EIU79791.1 hypothetical protein MM1S1540310_3144 [Mycobacteroides abscessus subsp. bolletii 1S-154-0310]MBE5481567.1 hypothetical prote
MSGIPTCCVLCGCELAPHNLTGKCQECRYLLRHKLMTEADLMYREVN